MVAAMTREECDPPVGDCTDSDGIAGGAKGRLDHDFIDVSKAGHRIKARATKDRKIDLCFHREPPLCPARVGLSLRGIALIRFACPEFVRRPQDLPLGDDCSDQVRGRDVECGVKSRTADRRPALPGETTHFIC